MTLTELLKKLPISDRTRDPEVQVEILDDSGRFNVSSIIDVLVEDGEITLFIEGH